MFFISKISVNRVKKRITMHRAYMCFKHKASLASGSHLFAMKITYKW